MGEGIGTIPQFTRHGLIEPTTPFTCDITISHRGNFPTGLILAITAAYLMGVAGGVAAIELLNWTLYLVAASCVVKTVRSVLTA